MLPHEHWENNLSRTMLKTTSSWLTQYDLTWFNTAKSVHVLLRFLTLPVIGTSSDSTLPICQLLSWQVAGKNGWGKHQQMQTTRKSKPLGNGSQTEYMIYNDLYTTCRVRYLDPGSQSAQALQDWPNRPLLSCPIRTNTAPAPLTRTY